MLGRGGVMREMLLINPVLVSLLAAALSGVVIALRLRFHEHGLDVPGHRSLHSRPTPHGGGLGIVSAVLVCGVLLGLDDHWLVTILALALVSWVDDWVDLAVWIRLGAQAGCAFYLTLMLDMPVWFVAALQILLIVWTTNAYNFMDGADGLAGSMAVTGFAVYALAFASQGRSMEAGLAAAISGAAAAFLCFNWHPARIFMGDGGSIPLGFLAGALGWHGAVTDAWPVWFGPLVFAPFLLDASVTLLRRALRGDRIWQAHREHYYQRMVRVGMTHAEMCRYWLLIMFAGGILALGLLRVADLGAWLAVAFWYGLLLFLGRRIDTRWAQVESAT